MIQPLTQENAVSKNVNQHKELRRYRGLIQLIHGMMSFFLFIGTIIPLMMIVIGAISSPQPPYYWTLVFGFSSVGMFSGVISLMIVLHKRIWKREDQQDEDTSSTTP